MEQYGGITGCSKSNGAGSGAIYNCFNTGKIVQLNTGNNVFATAGGILGSSDNPGTDKVVANVYNVGEIYNYAKNYKEFGGIIGGYWYRNDNICDTKNSYYLLDRTEFGYGGITTSIEGLIGSTKEFMYSEELVTKLNNYVESNEDGIDTTGWCKWKIDSSSNVILDFNIIWNGTEWTTNN